MKRLLTITLLVFSLFGSVPLARAQITQDTVDFVNTATKKEDKVVGQIMEESPAGIKIKERNEIKLIPALDIKQVTYKHPTVGTLDFRTPFTKETNAAKATRPAEKRKLLVESLMAFETLLPQFKGEANIKGYRYILFKIAEVKVRLAESEPDNKALLKSAIDALNTFKDDHPGGWQIVPCLKLLADLHEQQGDLTAAAKAYEALRAIPDAPKELKDKSDLMIAQMLVRGKQYREAETKLEALFKAMQPTDPQRGFVQLYLVETHLAQNKLDQVEPALRSVLGSSSDPILKATAHNFLGDYYRQKNQDEDAFWEYLRVDALYTQERNEHAKALYYLWKLFDSARGNRARAQQCYEKLADKAFAGTEYQRKALAEKPPTPEKAP